MVYRVQTRTPSTDEPERSLARRAFSITGVLPAAVITGHLAVASAAEGPPPLARLSSGGWLLVAEVTLFWLPLSYHALYGLSLIGAQLRRSPTPKTPLSPQQKLQRLSAVVALAWLAYHAYETRILMFTGHLHSQDVYQSLCENLSSSWKFGVPLPALAYLVGLAACAYHMGYGLMSFCNEFGLTKSSRSKSLAAVIIPTLVLVLFLVAARAVVFFATGSRVLWSGSSLGCDEFQRQEARA